ncbi:response regulator transcription factor [Methylorubrum extorquens]|jgi:DNA-binding CsgD family transcriptional regulator|uniref:response regulator transcription factor n=1 Tax=Methylorubrum extorquens TaxID=408 RepID=UPI001EE5CC7C|nr:helix-turn-helix transcriptional regulator [Methylorubrum extorquens]MCG5249352.1 LuxR C-terminal-related transcriptional regulator [Methylorubrum extorquens]
MSRSCTRGQPAVFTSLPWNAQIGKVLQSIGTPYFHEELINLLGITVPTDAFWIIRYAGEALPDVVFTRGVSAQTERVYSKHCARIDPFFARWRSLREAGVFTLDALRANDPICASYSDIFLPAAEMDDELGILIPVTALNCYAIFLERRGGIFTNGEVHLLEAVLPAISGFFRSHLGRVFFEKSKVDFLTDAPPTPHPTAIFDHAGHEVYANESWSKATHRFPSLKRQAARLASNEGAESFSDEWILRVERLNSDFPLAPNGARLVLEKKTITAFPVGSRHDPSLFEIFTRREREVLRLMLKGLKNNEISAELGVGAGSIRNLKLRVYRKSGVSSEGELVSKFLSLATTL